MIHQRTLFGDRKSQVTDLVIPCIDVAGGRATEPAAIPGLRDPGSVSEITRRYTDEGATKIFLDVLDPWPEAEYLPDLVRAVSGLGVSLLVSVDNGVLPSADHAEALLDAGADAVSVSTSAVECPKVVREVVARRGGQHVLGVINSGLAGDAGDRVHVEGGRRPTRVPATAMAAELASIGVGALLANSLDQEGSGAGYDLRLTRAVAEASGLPVIASGGAGTSEHLREALESGSAAYVLVNAMVHAGRTSMAEIGRHLEHHWSMAAR
ncbi:HisA/HisF-related TIM barrel protein [Streptomyces fradiae]|uniref:HisA/HisF-related TIM barrel protein n=1 Tax=Streptomyces fradiae TaxID=1906 RepID=UPI0036C7C74F